MKDSVSGASSIEERAQYERAQMYFSHARGNMFYFLAGGLIIAILLFVAEVPLWHIIIWFSLFVVVAAALIFFEQSVATTAITLENYRPYLNIRIALGVFATMFYGVAVFLLPSNVEHVIELGLFLILSTLVTLVTLSFAVMPRFYLLVNAVSLFPMSLYFLWKVSIQYDEYYMMMFCGSFIWQAMVLQKTRVISQTAVEAITLQQRLHDEIQEHKQAKEAIRHMALHDPLTEIANRRYFGEMFLHTVSIAMRNESKFGLLSIDLNGFKPVNDRYGHTVGDELLRAVAQRLVETVRTSDFCARIGGDEFAVIVNGIDDAADVRDVVAKLQQALAEPFEIGADSICIGGSVGCSIYPDDGNSLSELILVADRNMYSEKRKSKKIRELEIVLESTD
ncbi:MAG: GGDEF domain-containing protein [Sideroxydans sp.]|nr:GGDEF domain-containing protein [Sideroxydans sp.]